VRFLAQHFQRVYDDANHASCLRAIRLARKAEIILIWNVDAKRATWDEGVWPWNFKGFLEHTVGMLVEEGRSLDVLTLSVRDACNEEVGWDLKERMLAPLKGMAGRARIVLGEVMVWDDREAELRMWLEKYLRVLNSTEP
jgi:hypothetical protein